MTYFTETVPALDRMRAKGFWQDRCGRAGSAAAGGRGRGTAPVAYRLRAASDVAHRRHSAVPTAAATVRGVRSRWACRISAPSRPRLETTRPDSRAQARTCAGSVRQRSRGARALGLLWEQDPLDVAEDGASGVQRTVRVVPNRVTQIGWVASRHCPRGEPVELFYVVLRQQPFGHQPHESRDVMGAWEIDAPCNQHRLDRLLGRLLCHDAHPPVGRALPGETLRGVEVLGGVAPPAARRGFRVRLIAHRALARVEVRGGARCPPRPHGGRSRRGRWG